MKQEKARHKDSREQEIIAKQRGGTLWPHKNGLGFCFLFMRLDCVLYLPFDT